VGERQEGGELYPWAVVFLEQGEARLWGKGVEWEGEEASPRREMRGRRARQGRARVKAGRH